MLFACFFRAYYSLVIELKLSLHSLLLIWNLLPHLELYSFEPELNSKVKFIIRPTVQSASLSWNKAPIWGLTADLYYCRTVAGLLMLNAFSDERTTDHAQKGQLYCWLAPTAQKTLHVVPILRLYWRAVRRLATTYRHSLILLLSACFEVSVTEDFFHGTNTPKYSYTKSSR
jgi:hypothetical protein